MNSPSRHRGEADATEAGSPLPSEQPSLIVRGLRKRFGRLPVIDGFSERFLGGAHALVGPNGVGKSTLLGLMAGALASDEGEIEVSGFDLRERPLAARQCIGYAPEESVLYPFMSGAELLRLVRLAKRVDTSPEQARLIRDFGLEESLGRRVENMSQGTRKKLLIAAALTGEPEVLLLDEPSNALDAGSLDALSALIREGVARRTIVFASHDETFVETVGARIVPVARAAPRT
ncbi:MAG: ABC transporter ATP-binding protein [Gammaproteobacteria bacterium]|nr:MAG: ABC transporter ATP-binding protein [Gammaproteobacteria bacterium]